MHWLLAILAIRLLALPPHATIDPFGSRSLMSVTSAGDVTATAIVDGYRARSLIWHSRSSRPSLVANDGSVVGDLRRLCENFPQSSTGPVVAGWLADGSIVATMQSPAIVDLDDTSGQYAPVVLHLRSNECLNMGNGVALATAGLYTAGYTAYIGGVPAPSNVVSQNERYVAMRWHDRTRESLGPGVAIAINALGNAVGSDVPPGKGTSFAGVPHARLWIGGSSVDPVSGTAASAAYAIDGRDRVTGMLQDGDGRHYAFLWKNGTLRRLDDLIPAPGWRFECGYAFTPDGGIVGIGTYRGTAEAFEIRGL